MICTHQTGTPDRYRVLCSSALDANVGGCSWVSPHRRCMLILYVLCTFSVRLQMYNVFRIGLCTSTDATLAASSCTIGSADVSFRHVLLSDFGRGDGHTTFKACWHYNNLAIGDIVNVCMPTQQQPVEFTIVLDTERCSFFVSGAMQTEVLLRRPDSHIVLAFDPPEAFSLITLGDRPPHEHDTFDRQRALDMSHSSRIV